MACATVGLARVIVGMAHERSLNAQWLWVGMEKLFNDAKLKSIWWIENWTDIDVDIWVQVKNVE